MLPYLENKAQNTSIGLARRTFACQTPQLVKDKSTAVAGRRSRSPVQLFGLETCAAEATEPNRQLGYRWPTAEATVTRCSLTLERFRTDTAPGSKGAAARRSRAEHPAAELESAKSKSVCSSYVAARPLLATSPSQTVSPTLYCVRK